MIGALMGLVLAAAAPPYLPSNLAHVAQAGQVIVVTSPSWDSPRGTLRAYERVGSGWRRVVSATPADLGWSGMAGASARRQDTGKTPAGTFAIPSAFGRLPDPGSDLPYRQIDNVDGKIKWNVWSFDEGMASRVPYGTPVTFSTLDAVARAESGLRRLGFAALRVRHYGDTARIELDLADLAAARVDHLCMEASSHGLAQHRLDGVVIAAAGFTNITRDHMDYHPTFDHYLNAKLRLFTQVVKDGGVAVVNADAAHAEICGRCVANLFGAGEPRRFA